MREISKIHQAGFTLILSMVFLVVLTILILSGLKSATFSESESGGYTEKVRTFQAAEAALRAGEDALKTDANCAQTTGVCTYTYNGTSYTTGAAISSLLTTWSTSQDTSAWPTLTSFDSSSTNVRGMFLVNRLVDAMGVSLTSNGCPMYQITAKGLGAEGSGVLAASSVNGKGATILQSIVRVCTLAS